MSIFYSHGTILPQDDSSNIPQRLKDYLIKNFSATWIQGARITKDEQLNQITIADDHNFFTFRLNGRATSADLMTTGGNLIIQYLPVKKENDKLNVHEQLKAQQNEFVESLKHLSHISPRRLESIMLQTMDLTSYRLDAWLTSLANERLEHLREKNQKGIYMGIFGWVENLVPKDVANAVDEGGYIQGSSYAHARQAVLRNGYLDTLE